MQAKRCAAAAALLVLIGGSAAAQPIWSGHGPYDGLPTATALLVHPHEPATLYAGTRTGPFRSLDGGNTWTPIRAGLESLEVTSMAFHPTAPDTLYAGLGRGDVATIPRSASGLVISTDRGLTWSYLLHGVEVNHVEIPTTLTSRIYLAATTGVYAGPSFASVSNGLGTRIINHLAVHHQDPMIVYAATSNGVFKTTNGGGLWSAIGLSGHGVTSVALDPSTPGTVFATTRYISPTDGGVWKTVADGEPWTRVSPTGGHLVILDPTSPSTVYAATAAGLRLSSDHGDTWSPTAWLAGNRALAVDPSTLPSTLYTGAENAELAAAGVHRSGDLGQTWVALNNGLDGARVVGEAVAVDPFTPSRIYLGASNRGIFRSDDGGTTWNEMNNGLFHRNVVSLAADPLVAGRVFAGTDGQSVFRSLDAGATWSWSGTGLNGSTVYDLVAHPQTPGLLYAGSINGVFRSSDAGGSWQAASNGLTNLIVRKLAIDPSNPSTLYAATDNRAFRSVDGGDSWAQLTAPSGQIRGFAVDPLTPANLFYSIGSLVRRSTDGGSTWLSSTGIPADALTGPIVIDGDTPSTLYVAVGARNDGVYRSVDSGATWTEANTGLRNRWIRALAIRSDAPDILYAASAGAGVFDTRREVGAECLFASCPSGNCVDGVCCDATCTDTCASCAAATTGGLDGTCGAVLAGSVTDNGCTGPHQACDGAIGPGSCLTLNTPTVTATGTRTATRTSTPTLTPNYTRTHTPTRTPSYTVTETGTPTETPTFTHTIPEPTDPPIPPTETPGPATETATATHTPAPTETESPTTTPSVTLTPSQTATQTPTASATATATPTSSATYTLTATPSDTASATPTHSATATDSPTPTASATATSTHTDTPTPPPASTSTASATQTSTPSPIATHTATVTLTASSTPTLIPTHTATVTASATPTPFGCPATPLAGCRNAGKSKLRIRNDANDQRDSLLWKWSRGAQTALAEYGDPLQTTSYALCLYDHSAGTPTVKLVARSGLCAQGGCWRASATSWRYKDRLRQPHGLLKIQLRSGAAGKAGITIKGNGANLPLPAPVGPGQLFHQDTSLTVQLIKSDGAGECWQSTFTAPALNSGDRFQDTGP